MDIFEKKMSYGQYIRYLMPSVMTMIFLSFYTTIDGFFLSKYAGSDALAAVNIVIPVTCVIFGTAVMLASGAGAIIGEYMGRDEYEKANKIFTLSTASLIIFSVVFTVIGVWFLRPISAFLGAGERLMEHVLPYAFVVFAGTLPMAFKLFFEYLVRTDGNPKVGLFMSFTGLILNVILDFVLVGIFKMGTLGAALGTTISISVSALIGLIYFLKFGKLKFVKFDWDIKTLVKSCANGSSEMLTELSTGITTLLFNLIVMKYFGEDGVAAVTIIMYIYYFFIAFYMGISVATAPVISYNYGANNKDKIKETLKYSFVTIGITAVLIQLILYFGGSSIVGLFVSEGHVYELTLWALKLFSPVFIFIGINVFMSGYFTALGDGVNSALISTLRSLIFVTAFIIILPKIIGVSGIWVTMPLSEIVTVFISVIIYKKKGLNLKTA